MGLTLFDDLIRLALWELIRISHLIQPRRRHSAKTRGISRRSPCWKRTTLLQFHAWRNGLTFCWRRPRLSSKIQEPSSPSISPTRTEKEHDRIIGSWSYQNCVGNEQLGKFCMIGVFVWETLARWWTPAQLGNGYLMIFIHPKMVW